MRSLWIATVTELLFSGTQLLVEHGDNERVTLKLPPLSSELYMPFYNFFNSKNKKLKFDQIDIHTIKY